ncbi:MAG TPA: hypothetical protein VMG82_39505 [Candidatus Sulfotelmatobacter sp.]|nr:hypothetical protein [Candidatus Sulfotelmatobacter sp.]
MQENDHTAPHPSAADRITAALLALLLGHLFALGPIRQVWKDHWLVKDGQRGTATLIKNHWSGHRVVIYEYEVGQKVYPAKTAEGRTHISIW